MFDRNGFWQEVLRVEASLPGAGPFQIRAEENGRLVEVDRRGAAESIVRGTARLATADEIAAVNQRQAVREALWKAHASQTDGAVLITSGGPR